MPDECDARGDMNGDGVVSAADVPAFVTALLQNGSPCRALADMNHDGASDAADIQPFVDALIP